MKKDRSAREKYISRRRFIKCSSVGLTGLVLGPLPVFRGNFPGNDDEWPPDAGKFRFHMIGQAHIDPVWLWPWSEGIAVVHSTFRAALDRMNENPDFCFTASSAQFYQWISDNDPSMLDEIRERINEGRWNVVGGWWVEPDMNIPGGEAMVRQGLYGQLTLQKLTGHRAKVAYCPDSFGHAGTVPQILRLQGMEDYIFMRPAEKEKTLPADLFWWEGADGTRILTYRIQFSYNDSRSVRNRVERILSQYRDQPMKSFMAFYGAGDHGGGATKENIRSVIDLEADKKAPRVFFSTTDNYFKEVRANPDPDLPTVIGDLQHHAPGCYTADSAIKKNNRQAEAALVAAEKIAAIGSYAWGCHYPKEELASAWKKVLFLQFHDSLAGTSLPEHSQAAAEGYGHALDVAHYTTYLSLQKLEWQVPSHDPLSQYLMVFNPHSWEVNTAIEYDLNGMQGDTRVEDESGNSLMHQWNQGSTETNRKRLVIRTKVPSMGYRQIRILNGSTDNTTGLVSAEGDTLENDFLKVTIAPDGSIGIFDRENRREVFSPGRPGLKALVIDDRSDTWSHDVKKFNDVVGSFGDPEVKVLENGPLRSVTRVVSSYGKSLLTVDLILYEGSRFLEARVTLDWHEKLKMLKFSFPVNVDDPVATYDIPFGNIERDTNGNEDPGQRWIDLSGKIKSGIYGLSVINDAKYGYSVPGNDLRISVVRSSPFAHHVPKVLDMNSEHIWMDQGIQTFRMLLVPHSDNWRKSSIPRLAEEFITPCPVIYQGIHGGRMAASGSFLSAGPGNIVLSTVKLSENGDDLILRCLETSGVQTFVSLRLDFAGTSWSGDFHPFEIKTLRFNRNTEGIKVVTLLEE